MLAIPILNGVSVYKTPASIEETDGYPLGLTYHSDRTADRANGQWNEEGEGVRGTSMWTKEKGASVTYQFEGTKAYVVATVDPGHGEMGCLSMAVQRPSIPKPKPQTEPKGL